MIAPTGNDGDGNVTYPGAFEEVFGVGAIDFDNNIWRNSGSSETKPDVVGYGVDIEEIKDQDYDEVEFEIIDDDYQDE